MDLTDKDSKGQMATLSREKVFLLFKVAVLLMKIERESDGRNSY